MSEHPLADRVRAIRFPNGELAKASGVEANTVSRTLRGRTDPRRSTDQRLEAAIVAEERRLRDYLLDLHPIATRTGVAA